MKEIKIALASVFITLVGLWLIFLFYTEQAEVLAMFRDIIISLFLIGILLSIVFDTRKDKK